MCDSGMECSAARDGGAAQANRARSAMAPQRFWQHLASIFLPRQSRSGSVRSRISRRFVGPRAVDSLTNATGSQPNRRWSRFVGDAGLVYPHTASRGDPVPVRQVASRRGLIGWSPWTSN